MRYLAHRRSWLLGLLAMPLAGVAMAAEAVHGANAVYIGPTVSIGWVVLRGTEPADATVLLRVVNSQHEYRFVALDGSNPFNQQRAHLVAAAPLADSAVLKAPRSRFAEFPSCEIRLYRSQDEVGADQSALVVFYLGVPDTTPEFADSVLAEAYLDQVLASPRHQ